MPEWISAKEEVPPEGGPYTVLYRGQEYSSSFCNMKFMLTHIHRVKKIIVDDLNKIKWLKK